MMSLPSLSPTAGGARNEPDDLLALVLHDLQNHLTAASGYLQLLQMDEATLSEKHARFVRSSRLSAHNVQSMAQGLQTLLHVIEGRLTARVRVTNITETTAAAWKAASEETGLTQPGTFDAPPGESRGRCDSDLLGSALQRLFGGVLRRQRNGTSATVRLARVSKEQEISIVDSHLNGTAEEIRAAIDAVTRELSAKRYWRGEDLLDLRLAFHLTRISGASLSMTLAEGGGIRFSVTVPAAE